MQFAVIAAALLVAVLAYRQWRVVDEIRPLTPPPPSDVTPAPAVGASAESREVLEAPTHEGRPALGDPSSAAAAGRVRARVRLAGAAPSMAFEVVVRPTGEEAQVHGFAPGQELVDLDLPLGSLDVQARAPALASLPLTLIHDDDAPIPPIELELLPAGGLTVSATCGNGASLHGLPLVVLADDNRARFRGVLDAGGNCTFVDLPAAGYSVMFGAGDSGIVPPERARVVAGDVVALGPVTLPDLGEAIVVVTDRSNQPVAGARVFGAGQRGGFFDAWTQADGSARARFLPEGIYFLDVIVDSGPRGRGQLDVQVSRVARASIQVR